MHRRGRWATAAVPRRSRRPGSCSAAGMQRCRGACGTCYSGGDCCAGLPGLRALWHRAWHSHPVDRALGQGLRTGVRPISVFYAYPRAILRRCRVEKYASEVIACVSQSAHDNLQAIRSSIKGLFRDRPSRALGSRPRPTVELHVSVHQGVAFQMDHHPLEVALAKRVNELG